MSGSVAFSFLRQTADLLRRHAAHARADMADALDFGAALGRTGGKGEERDDGAVVATERESQVHIPLASMQTELRGESVGSLLSGGRADIEPRPMRPERALAKLSALAALEPAAGEPTGIPRQGRAADVDRGASILADVKVETHFEPVAMPRAVTPLAARLVEVLPAAEIGEAPAPAIRTRAGEGEMAPLPEIRAGAPVRVLKIELRPADLGVLHVSLRIIAGRLEVSVAASTAETVRWLEGNREALGQALRAEGREFAEIDIRIVSHDPGSAAEALAASALRPAQAERGSARTADQRQAGGEGRQRIRRSDDERDADGSPDRDGGVYL